VVFNLKPPPRPAPTPFGSWNEIVLHDFNGPDGSTPFSDPVFDPAGNLYLPTLFGGAHGQGAVVELTPASGGWTETVLYSFTGGSDGGWPGRSLVFDNAGNIYGTASNGGVGNGVVFELSPSGSGWTEKVLHTFQGGNEGATPIAGLFLDAAGNLYGGTAYEGAGGGGTVFQLSPSGGGWTLTTLYSFTGNLGPLAPLTMDATGTLYGTSNHDGAYNFGTVFKLTPSNGGWTYTSLHDFTGGSDGGYPFSDVLFDGHGNMFGTAEVGGNQNVGVVWEITP
jgi:uncharacterized repeat protein (TIGR03803 family)